MPSLSWLHLTDLHCGLSGQQARWSAVRQAFYDDLSRLAERAGPWDLVLFTGDLTQRGSVEEFKRLDDTLHPLLAHLKTLGSTPALFTVPGNHDLARPSVTAAVRALRGWHDDRDLREEFWSSDDNEYRALLREAFAAYEGFAARWPAPEGFTVRSGMLPGDRSISLCCNGIKLTLVGLNSTFLQLEGGDYKGRLDLDPRQLLAVCDDDPGLFVDAHHVALLLTHHPVDWLHSRALSDHRADIAPPGRFVAHLFGHMHEPSTRSESIGGAATQRSWQGPSLFGLETYGDGHEARIHGYTAGRITAEAQDATATLWPRVSSLNLAGAWQIVPDHTRFVLDAQDAVRERFRLRLPLGADDSAPTPTHAASKAPTPPRSKPHGSLVAPATPPVTSDARASLRDARRALLGLYDQPGSIRRVLHDAGVSTERVDLSGAASDIWFNALQEAEKSGRVGAILAVARDEYPANAELQRLVREPSLQGAGAHALDSSPNEFSLYEALGRLLSSQFELVLFRLAVPVHLLPPSTAPQSDRAIALLRLMSQQGRLRDLAVALAAVTTGR